MSVLEVMIPDTDTTQQPTQSYPEEWERDEGLEVVDRTKGGKARAAQ